MGFGRRLIRKTVRKATPRTVRRAMHPVRTVKNAVTPRPVQQLSRAVYTVTNPLGAAENKLIGAMLNGGGHRRSRSGSGGGQPRPSATSSRIGPAGGVRAAEAAASRDRIGELMAVQRERFAEPHRPVVPAPAPVSPTPFRNAEWAQRKHEVRFWQRSRRRRLLAEVDQFAQAQAAESNARLRVAHQQHQAAADAWWHDLCSGEPQVLTAALKAAYADNPAPVAICAAQRAGATLIVVLPGTQVLPAKEAHITPTGRLSSKAWTKTEFNEVYGDLLGAHLLATIRETWAVGRSLTQLRIIGVRWGTRPAADVLFDVDVDRNNGQWANDTWGSVVLQHSAYGLNRIGRTHEIQPWAPDKLRADVARLTGAFRPSATM